MQKRRFEKVAVVLLSIIMLLTSTGIVSTLASNVVSESSSASVSSTTESTTQATSEETSSSSSSAESEEGAVPMQGTGTAENPFMISELEQLLAVSSRVSGSAEVTYFMLAEDIDLASVTAEDFASGSLLGLKSDMSVSFDGNGHTLKNLNVELSRGTEASVFGSVGEKSVIKNITIAKPVIKSISAEMKNIAVVAAENKGTVSGVTVTYPVLTAASADFAAFIAAVNLGSVANSAVTSSQTNIGAATAEKYTISSVGSVGAVAGINRGSIANVSAINIGMFIPNGEKSTVYGGIVGSNSGAVLNSVSTGNAMGGKASDVVGGIVGKAIAPLGGSEATSNLTNNYTLISLSKTASGCGVIGVGGKASMMSDCFWSSIVSGKNVSVDGFGAGVDEIAADEFMLIPVGKSVTLSADDAKASAWGKAIFELNGEINVKGDGFTTVTKDGITTVTANTYGKAAKVSYTAKVMLPTNVGADGAAKTLKQYMRVTLIAVAEDAKGDGSAENPFIIKTSSDFALYKYAPRMNTVLGADIKASTVPAITGAFNGNGHTVTVNKPLVSNVYGEIKNVNIVVSAKIGSAVLGNSVGAKVSGVSVRMADGAVLEASASSRGVLFNAVSGQSVIDDCRVQGNVIVKAKDVANVGGFAGVVNGDGTSITNSGAISNITADGELKAKNTAGFIGSIDADDVNISACYVGGENLADKFMFVSAVAGKNIKVENITTAFGEAIALDFEKYADINENQFNKWSFENGAAGFFTGNGGKFSINLPSIKAFESATAEDFSVVCDAKTLISKVTLDGGKVTVSVERAKGIVTVRAIPVTLVHTKTGLSATIHVSNGLEKDSLGRYVISSAYDLAYFSENISELHSADFIMMNDVDMAELDAFAPIGTTEVAFSGTFDGNGKVIDNLTIDGTAKVGLFGVLNGATVKNVTFKNADISAQGGYAGVLAGQVTGEASVSGITVDGAKVTTSDLYAGAVFGAVDSNTAKLTVSGIKVKNSKLESEANYVGALAGRVNGDASIMDITVADFTASGASYVAGVAGLIKSENGVTLRNVNVTDANISGVSEISGVAGGNGKVAISDAHVKSSEISTVANTSVNTAGGISAVFGSEISNVSVEGTVISGGTAGGIVGKTTEDCKLTVTNANVSACEIKSSDVNTAAAGILGVHNVKGVASIKNATVDSQTVIGGGAVNAGLVGDCSGVESKLTVKASKTLAAVNSGMGENAIASAGALGKLGISAVNNVTVTGVKVGGSVNGGGDLGGVIGTVKGGKAFEAYAPIVSDCTVFADINPENASAVGLIIGGVQNENIFGEKAQSAVNGVVVSTFCGAPAYGSEIFRGGYVDMDSSVEANPSVLTSKDETTVQITGLPTVEGFAFDTESGWVSESDERIQVISSDAESAVLMAQRYADVSIVGYYVLSSDSDVRVPVHFRMVSTVSEPLNGSGTQADPYLINDAYDLETMAGYANEGAHFVLTADIALTEADFEFGGAFYNVGNGIITIGNAREAFNGTFTGLYNGEVHSITGLKMQGNTFGGLFGATDGAVISDLVINNADVSALAYGGVLIGRANDTTIKNVTINSSSVSTVSFGSVVGGVVGGAQSTEIEDVTINGVEINTTLEATDATLEYAGGVAGAYDGTIKNVNITSASVVSDAVAGGFIGVTVGDTAYISQSLIDAQITAKISGGVVGVVDDMPSFGLTGVQVSGKIYGEEKAAGIVADIAAESEFSSFDKLNRSLVSDTVIAASITGDGVRAIVIADVSESVATDSENENVDVFENVYYSSYQNQLGAFGAEKFNSYQSSEYDIIDLSDLSFSENGTVSDTVLLGDEFTVLSEGSIILGGGDGSFKSFTAGGRAFELLGITSDIDGLVTYDAQTSSVKLNSELDGNAKLVFCYSGGLELAIGISAKAPEAVKTVVNVNCGIVNATGNAELSDKLVAVMLKVKDAENVKSAEFFTELDTASKAVGAFEIADGKLYVDMHLPEGCRFNINAVDENGNTLNTEAAGNEGVIVEADDAASISLSIAVENSNEGKWGLRALWSVIGK